MNTADRVFARVDAIDPSIKYVVFIDFETYYSKSYTLRELTSYEYVYNEQFCPYFAYVCFFPRNGTPREKLFTPEALIPLLEKLDPSVTLFVAHNAMFDGLVLYRLFPVRFRWWCTMQAAHQMLLPQLGSVSLDRLARHFGLAVDKSTIVKMQGRRIETLSPAEYARFVSYVRQDVHACVEIFASQTLLGEGEADLLMWTIDRALYPRLRVDLDMLEAAVANEAATLEAGFSALGVTPTQVRSAHKFAELLDKLGVEVEYKPGANGPIPAVAKTDPFMTELLGHANPVVAQLAELRLASMRTLQRTRAARMLAVGRALDGFLPVPLHYHRARTGRWTGAEKLNLQNLSRGAGPLRRAIMAAPGRRLVVVDAAQIEARIVAAIAGAHDLTEAFAKGRDVYSEFATRLYGHPVDKKNHPTKRQVGKLAVLSLGYGCGADKFHWIARVSGGITLEPGEAERVVETYRSTWPEIPRLWRLMDTALHRMLRYEHFVVSLPAVGGPLDLQWDAPLLILPSGRPIVFSGLEYDSERNRIMVVHAQHGRLIRRPMWGGHVVENIVQAMARDVLCTTHRLFIDKVVLQVHDELVLDVAADEAEDVLNACIQSLSSHVPWLSGCVFSAEGGIAERYGDAK